MGAGWSFIFIFDQVSHSYKTTGKTAVLCILIFIFLDSKLEDKIFGMEWEPAFHDFSLLLISSWMEFWFIRVVPKYLNCYALSKILFSIFTLWFCPAFWSRDMTTYLVGPAFTSKPIPLLATTISSVFFLIVCTLPSNTLSSSEWFPITLTGKLTYLFLISAQPEAHSSSTDLQTSRHNFSFRFLSL